MDKLNNDGKVDWAALESYNTKVLSLKKLKLTIFRLMMNIMKRLWTNVISVTEHSFQIVCQFIEKSAQRKSPLSLFLQNKDLVSAKDQEELGKTPCLFIAFTS